MKTHPLPERDDEIPAGAPGPTQTPALAAVHHAWAAATRSGDPRYPPLAAALATFAAEGRSVADVTQLLRALDALTRHETGGDPQLDWDSMRAWAGSVVIEEYYRPGRLDDGA